MKTRYRDTVAEINLNNLYSNYNEVQKRVGSKKIIPVVKANAYGHGVIQVVEYLYDKGIDYFAVSLLEEALELRKIFPTIGILVMGIVDEEGLLIASENNITITMSNLSQIQNINKYTNMHNVVHFDENEKFGFSKSNENISNTKKTKISQNSSFLEFSKNNHKKQDEDEILEKAKNSTNMSKKSEALNSIEKLKVEQSSISIESLKMKKTLKVHIKIDTGMNRLGYKFDDEIKFVFDQLISNPMIEVEGLFTHFSTADVDKSYYDIQMRRFSEVLLMLSYKFKFVHSSNSSSQIKYENAIPYTTHTRLGISLYGLTLDKETLFLNNTFMLKTKISQFKKLLPGDKVGYGATYTASGHEIIGVLPIGYADGFIRKNQGGDVEINGKRYPIVGRICMDQLFIKVDETVSKNDDVILFGGLISIDEVAHRLDTINYEVICSVSDRVPREYIE